MYSHFTPVSARDLLTKDTRELREALKEMKMRGAAAADAGGGGPSDMDFGPGGGAAAPAAPRELPAAAQRQLHGHSRELHALSWSPAAGLLASASADGSVRVWEAAGGNSVACTPAGGADPSEMMIAVEWAPDGQALAAASAGGAVLVWGRDGALRAALRGHAGAPMTLAWNRRGDLLASGGADGAVIVWDVKAGAERQRWAPHGAAQTGVPAVYDVDWRNNSVLAAGWQDGSVAVYKVGAEAALRACKDHVTAAAEAAEAGEGQGGAAPEVNAVRWDPAGRVLASASNDMTVRLWAPSGDAPARVLAGHKREVMALAWSPPAGGGAEDKSGAVLASGSADGSVRLWNPESGACLAVLDRHLGGIFCLGWSPDGSRLAAGDEEGNVSVWAVRPGGGGALAVSLRDDQRMQVAALQWMEGGGALAVAFDKSPAVTLADLRAP